MANEIFDSENVLRASHKHRNSGVSDEERMYTQKFESCCPVDSSRVVHTVRFIKATCTRVDDIVDDFKCSRNGSCVKCMENYR